MTRVQINFGQHTQCSNMTFMAQQQESLIRARPGHRIHLTLKKLIMTFSSRPIKLEKNSQGLGEQMQSGNETTQRYPQRHASLTSK